VANTARAESLPSTAKRSRKRRAEKEASNTTTTNARMMTSTPATTTTGSLTTVSSFWKVAYKQMKCACIASLLRMLLYHF
jgi:hypothetical protein